MSDEFKNTRPAALLQEAKKQEPFDEYQFPRDEPFVVCTDTLHFRLRLRNTQDGLE
jgi:hypothetical protein